jgi:hypothetical protein
MWGQAPILLKQLMASGKVKLFVTGSMWENYYDSLIANCCVEGSWRMGQDGKTELFYRGIPVIPIWIADYTLENDTDNPYYNLLRHFAIMTLADNNIFGTESSSDLDNLEICYDCRTKTTYIQGESRFGVNYIQCDLTVIAY